MTVISRRWRTRPGVELFDLATRWPLYLLSGSEPLIAALVVMGQPSVPLPVAAAVVLVAVAHTAACVAVLRGAFSHRLGGPGPDTRLAVAAVGLTAAGLVLAVTALPAPGALLFEDGFPMGFGLSMLFVGGLTVAVTPLLRLRFVVLLVVASAVATEVAQRAVGADDQLPWVFNYVFMVLPFVLTYRLSAWMLAVVWEIDRARGVAARLAVAEERLRVARDLHDVLGRNLTLISANSELAARLVTRDPDAAAERMLHVRQVAQDSMREARDVVGGARTTDLEAELAGARSVLRSAGIDTRVIGDGAHLPPDAQTALGWVVREATTNVLRHAEPSWVRIEVDAGPVDGRRVARLRVENDGVRGPGPDRGSASRPGPGMLRASGPPGGGGTPAPGQDGHGTGLAGLQDRLGVLGGTLAAGADGGGRFAVEVSLPVGDQSAHLTSRRPT